MNKLKSTQMDRIDRNSRIPRIPAGINGGMKSIADLEQIHHQVKDYNISSIKSLLLDDWYSDRHPQ